MKRSWSISTTPSSSEITPEALFHTRRQFITLGATASAAAILAACSPSSAVEPQISKPNTETALTPEEDVIGFNNFYEFTVDKEGVAALSKDFVTKPWNLEVSGLVNKPSSFGVEDLVKKFGEEERIYRLRCVEGWSMVIPWLGFSLSKLIKEVEPLSSAAFVRFVTLFDPDQFPEQNSPFYPWPYEEGLRLDEALHPLTILSTGLYGKSLPPQNGAPLRLVVPWKYGFKSIKSIVRIELVEQQPATFWNNIAPNEYGFYANVNPLVNHPRWSQASERRIGEINRRPTLMFNGYEADVAGLYVGMDLAKNY